MEVHGSLFDFFGSPLLKMTRIPAWYPSRQRSLIYLTLTLARTALLHVNSVEVPGYTHIYLPLPGTERGTAESLVHTYEDVFNEDMLREIDAETPSWAKLGATVTGSLKHGKYATFWMQLTDKPRTALEHAVKLLEDVVFPPELGGAKAFGIVGCKYWVQRRPGGEDVGYHFDKDEGLASNHQKMLPPPYVGVLHLDNWGAPTVVFNRTTVNNGNLQVPLLPESGWFVYPKRNKYALHRGDLFHGASDSLAARPVPDGEMRTTFITSWETHRLHEPNCHRVTNEEMPAKIRELYPMLEYDGIGKLNRDIHRGELVEPVMVDPELAEAALEAAVLAADEEGSTAAEKEAAVEAALAYASDVNDAFEKDEGEVEAVGANDTVQRPTLYEVRMTLGEYAAFDMMPSQPETTTLVRWRPGAKYSRMYSNYHVLELRDSSMMHRLHNSRVPVSIVFGRSQKGDVPKVKGGFKAVGGAKILAAQAIAVMTQSVPFNKKAPIAVYVTDVRTAPGVMRHFGLPRKTVLPTAVVQDPRTNRRYRTEARDLPLTEESLVRFWRDVLEGKRKPINSKEL